MLLLLLRRALAPRRVGESETRRGPGASHGRGRGCALAVDHQSPRERGESRASRCIIPARLFPRARLSSQAYASVKRPPARLLYQVTDNPCPTSLSLFLDQLLRFRIKLLPLGSPQGPLLSFQMGVLFWSLGCTEVPESFLISVCACATSAIRLERRFRTQFDE